MTLDLFAHVSPRGEIELVHKQITECARCKYREAMLHPLHGWGCLTRPTLFVIGQFPGRGEDVLGQILSKDAGKFIREQFYSLGLSDKEIYWGNAVNCCIPPEATEIEDDQLEACAAHLEGTIDALRPKVIVGLGNNARKRLFYPKYMREQKSRVSSLLDSRFKVWDYRGFKMVILNNPAGVLRKKGFERSLYEDELAHDVAFMRTVLEKIKEL